VWTRQAFFPRSFRLGAALARMYAKHGDPEVLRLAHGERPEAAFLRRMQATCESLHSALEKAQALLCRIETEHRGARLSDALVAQLSELVARVNAVPLYAGMLSELAGADPRPVLERGPARGRLTSVIVPTCGSLPALQDCLEALRREREADHPL